MPKAKCILILSEKSSGSSACQKLLSKYAHIRHVNKTRHYQNETLYWTKAASVLRMPQINMVDSEVPLSPDNAKADLLRLLKQNLKEFIIPEDDTTMIMEGWRKLCTHYSPVFLEKSPHHLCQWSALELIQECVNTLDDVDFLLIGLIRNPMDTIYSQYRQWKSPPEKVEKQWREAYNNLLKLKNSLKKNVFIIRYEDMVTSLNYLEPVFKFCKVQADTFDDNFLHKKSIHKWKKDHFYGFSLSDETVELAKEYGYKQEDMENESFALWPLVRNLSRFQYQIYRNAKRFAKKILKEKSNTD